jgi:hypothetical protein
VREWQRAHPGPPLGPEAGLKIPLPLRRARNLDGVHDNIEAVLPSRRGERAAELRAHAAALSGRRAARVRREAGRSLTP